MSLIQYTYRDCQLEEKIAIEKLSEVSHAWGSAFLDIFYPDNDDVSPIYAAVHLPNATAFEWVTVSQSNQQISTQTLVQIKRIFIETRVLLMPAPSEMIVWIDTDSNQKSSDFLRPGGQSIRLQSNSFGITSIINSLRE